MMETNSLQTVCVDEIFNDSYERCTKNSDFIDSLYANFAASCEVVSRTLSDTDITQQKGSVEAPLYNIMALRTLKSEDAVAHFRRIYVDQAQQGGGPVYYDLWKKCLLKAVAKCDKRYNADVEAAWTEVLSGGIKIMKSL